VSGLFLFIFIILLVNYLMAHPLQSRRRGRIEEEQRRFRPPRRTELTNAQVDTLLRVTDNRLTAAKLAAAAGVSEEKAKKFLDKMVLDSKLDVEAGDGVLVYHR
jgi:response regulator of citrate/malate metabolism